MTPDHKNSATVLTDRDNDRLWAITAGLHGGLAEASGFLAPELENAHVIESVKIPPDVVTMNTRVSVRNEETGETRMFTLVYPRDEDISLGYLSILTPVGAALLGSSEGEMLEWIARDGQSKELTVVEVLYQPEANGRFDL